MNLVVLLEHRFCYTLDRRVWTRTTFAYSFWERYKEVFDTIRIVARARPCQDISNKWTRVDGEGVSLGRIPHYVGPWQYLLHAREVAASLHAHVQTSDAVIMRVPSHLANLLTRVLSKRGQPFALEVLGDPYEVFGPGSVAHPLRPLLRWWFTRCLQTQCAKANAVAYVTRYALQRRFPSGSNIFSCDYSCSQLAPSPFSSSSYSRPPRFATHFSDIELDETAFSQFSPTRLSRNAQTFKVITVGSLEQKYKGTDVLIDSVAAAVRDGLDVSLSVVGDGKYRPALETRVLKWGLGQRVQFLGQLPSGDAVRAELDKADLFVLPSRTEGLPRAMLEAMARGLPCIGSKIGGIPELLAPEDLIPPNDRVALARKMSEVLTTPDRLLRMAARNYSKAQEYSDDVLRQRRVTFYRYVKERTEEWQKAEGVL